MTYSLLFIDHKSTLCQFLKLLDTFMIVLNIVCTYGTLKNHT